MTFRKLRDRVAVATLCLIVGLPGASAQAASPELKMLDIAVEPLNAADRSGPGQYYLGSPLKIRCRYQWGDHAPNWQPPPLEIRFYNEPHAPGSGIVGASKVGAPGFTGAINTAVADFKTDLAGTIGLSCRITEGGYLYKSSGANQATTTIQVVPRPAKPVALRNPSTAASAPAAGAAGLTPFIKTCPTSLSAAITVNSYQLAGPQQSPATAASASLILHFKSAEAFGDNIACRYATENKDVPDLVVTIKCPNASAQSGQPTAYHCTN